MYGRDSGEKPYGDFAQDRSHGQSYYERSDERAYRTTSSRPPLIQHPPGTGDGSGGQGETPIYGRSLEMDERDFRHPQFHAAHHSEAIMSGGRQSPRSAYRGQLTSEQDGTSQSVSDAIKRVAREHFPPSAQEVQLSSLNPERPADNQMNSSAVMEGEERRLHSDVGASTMQFASELPQLAKLDDGGYRSRHHYAVSDQWISDVDNVRAQRTRDVEPADFSLHHGNRDLNSQSFSDQAFVDPTGRRYASPASRKGDAGDSEMKLAELKNPASSSILSTSSAYPSDHTKYPTKTTHRDYRPGASGDISGIEVERYEYPSDKPPYFGAIRHDHQSSAMGSIVSSAEHKPYSSSRVRVEDSQSTRRDEYGTYAQPDLDLRQEMNRRRGKDEERIMDVRGDYVYPPSSAAPNTKDLSQAVEWSKKSDKLPLSPRSFWHQQVKLPGEQTVGSMHSGSGGNDHQHYPPSAYELPKTLDREHKHYISQGSVDQAVSRDVSQHFRDDPRPTPRYGTSDPEQQSNSSGHDMTDKIARLTKLISSDEQQPSSKYGTSDQEHQLSGSGHNMSEKIGRLTELLSSNDGQLPPDVLSVLKQQRHPDSSSCGFDTSKTRQGANLPLDTKSYAVRISGDRSLPAEALQSQSEKQGSSLGSFSHEVTQMQPVWENLERHGLPQASTGSMDSGKSTGEKDSVIQRILSSIGFDFDMSQQMQGLAKSGFPPHVRRQQPSLPVEQLEKGRALLEHPKTMTRDMSTSEHDTPILSAADYRESLAKRYQEYQGKLDDHLDSSQAAHAIGPVANLSTQEGSVKASNWNADSSEKGIHDSSDSHISDQGVARGRAPSYAGNQRESHHHHGVSGHEHRYDTYPPIHVSHDSHVSQELSDGHPTHTQYSHPRTGRSSHDENRKEAQLRIRDACYSADGPHSGSLVCSTDNKSKDDSRSARQMARPSSDLGGEASWQKEYATGARSSAMDVDDQKLSKPKEVSAAVARDLKQNPGTKKESTAAETAKSTSSHPQKPSGQLFTPEEFRYKRLELDDLQTKMDLLDKELNTLKRQENELMRRQQKKNISQGKDPLLEANAKLQSQIQSHLSQLDKKKQEKETEIRHAVVVDEDFAQSIIKEEPKEKKPKKKAKKELNQDFKKDFGDEAKKEASQEAKKEVVPETKPIIHYAYFDGGQHFCILCQNVLKDMEGYLEHIRMADHLKRVADDRPWAIKDDEIPDQPDAVPMPVGGVQFMVGCQAYYCVLCKLFYGDLVAARAHLRSADHNERHKRESGRQLRDEKASDRQTDHRETEKHKGSKSDTKTEPSRKRVSRSPTQKTKHEAKSSKKHKSNDYDKFKHSKTRKSQKMHGSQSPHRRSSSPPPTHHRAAHKPRRTNSHDRRLSPEKSSGKSASKRHSRSHSRSGARSRSTSRHRSKSRGRSRSRSRQPLMSRSRSRSPHLLRHRDEPEHLRQSDGPSRGVSELLHSFASSEVDGLHEATGPRLTKAMVADAWSSVVTEEIHTPQIAKQQVPISVPNETLSLSAAVAGAANAISDPIQWGATAAQQVEQADFQNLPPYQIPAAPEPVHMPFPGAPMFPPLHAPEMFFPPQPPAVAVAAPVRMPDGGVAFPGFPSPYHPSPYLPQPSGLLPTPSGLLPTPAGGLYHPTLNHPLLSTPADVATEIAQNVPVSGLRMNELGLPVSASTAIQKDIA